MYLESHDYQIYYVNIDLRHQYGISATESQTFLLAKRPQWRRARRNGCFRRLVYSYLLQVYKEKGYRGAFMSGWGVNMSNIIQGWIMKIEIGTNIRHKVSHTSKPPTPSPTPLVTTCRLINWDTLITDWLQRAF